MSGASEHETHGEPRPARVVRALRRVGGWLVRLPRALGVVLACAWMATNHWLSSGVRGPAGDSLVWSYLSNLFHAPLYGLLALWWVVALPRRDEPFRWARLGARQMVGVWLAVLAWGVLDELHQSRVPGRDASVADLVTDGSAAAAVLVVAAFLGRPGADASGTWKRLALGLAACLIAAAVATEL
ncbi:MAG: VanZ family protein [Planctomycetota bacterium]